MFGLKGSAAAVRDAVRTQLWPLPTAGIVLALALGIGLPRLDGRLDQHLPGWVRAYLFGGDSGSARTVLDAISSSLITVTSLTFSLTVVTLQLASSQFSPRLLRTFTRDMFVEATLAVFLATFVYSLTVLRSVRSASDDKAGQTAFVPRISVTVGFAFAVLSVLGLVLFLAHLAQQIRVEDMLKVVHTDASETVDQTLDDHDGRSRVPAEATAPPDDAVMVLTPQSGFLVHVDEQALCAAAVRADAVVMLAAYPGTSLIAGTPLSLLWRHDHAGFDDDARAELTRAVRAAVTVGFERTATQDVAFGLRQLTDVANKALSPGINDPTTAVHALGHSAALLCQLAGKDLGPRRVRDDDDGTVRVILGRPELADLVELAVAQPRRYGAADPDVLARLFGLLRELAWVARAAHHTVVTEQLTRLRGTVADQSFDDTERARLAKLGRLVDAALTRQWPMTETDT